MNNNYTPIQCCSTEYCCCYIVLYVLFKNSFHRVKHIVHSALSHCCIFLHPRGHLASERNPLSRLQSFSWRTLWTQPGKWCQKKAKNMSEDVVFYLSVLSTQPWQGHAGLAAPCPISVITYTLTLSTPAVPNCCCSNGPAPYWSNPPF